MCVVGVGVMGNLVKSNNGIIGRWRRVVMLWIDGFRDVVCSL